MEKNKKIRNHPFYIIENLWGIVLFEFFFVFPAVTGLVAGTVKDDVNSLLDMNSSLIVFGILFGILAVAVAVNFVIWKNCYIYLEDDELILIRGALFKRKLVMPIEKINTIDIKRGIVQRIFGLCRMSVDTGSVVARQVSVPELTIILNIKTAEQLKEYLSAKSRGKSPSIGNLQERESAKLANAKSYKMPFFDYVAYGLTAPKVIWIILVVLSVFEEASDMIFDLLGNISAEAVGTVTDAVLKVNLAVVISAGIVIVLGAYIVISLISVLIAWVRFFNFTVTRNGDSVNIKYGLLTLKNYTLPVRNIHAVVIKQNFIRQLFGLCAVEAISIGFGDSDNEVAYLIPIIKRKKLDGVIKEILPEYCSDIKAQRAPARALLWFVLKPLVWWSVLTAAVYFTVNLIWKVSILEMLFVQILLAVIVILTVISGVLNFCHSRLGFNEKSVLVSSGGIWRIVTVMRCDCVQSAESRSGVIQRLFKICSYVLDYHAPALKTTVPVRNLRRGYAEKIAELIEK